MKFFLWTSLVMAMIVTVIPAEASVPLFHRKKNTTNSPKALTYRKPAAYRKTSGQHHALAHSARKPASRTSVNQSSHPNTVASRAVKKH